MSALYRNGTQQTRKNKYAGNKRKLSTDGNTGSIIKRVKNNDDQNIANQNIFTEEALGNLKIYNELKTQYEEEGVNQQTHQFLSRISRKKILDDEKLNKVPLMQHLSNAAKAMMLSEFEIAAWATWLDKIDLLVPNEYTPEDYILFTSFYIKMSLNEEEFLNGMFQSYFNCYIRGFIEKFNKWLKTNKNLFQFNPIEVNKKFKELNRPFNPQKESDFIDYNHCVDDILQISPPYNYCGDKNQKAKSKPFEGGMASSQKFDNTLLSASQKSVVPTKKKILTIPADASQHLINWNPTINDDEINHIGPMTRLSKKKSSVLSIKDVNPSIIKPMDDELLKKPSNNISQFDISQQLSNLYNLDNNDEGNDNFDLQLAKVLDSNNAPTKIHRSIARRPPVAASNKPFSGFSNYSNNNDFTSKPGSQINQEGSNLFKNISSFNLVKIPMNDIFDVDDEAMKNLPEIPNISSRGNSYQNLLKNDSTPTLFKRGSSVIDQRMFKKN
ncbi:unnamed protein product [Moneuplotes crassus]|uniref:Uncharacterized protein n=1 Tax=Euplotes crassus TaxID=5936 RepID=A0AAD1U9K4_EUPCR|nr:unnamed protein product [Moneuplotes crassus]